MPVTRMPLLYDPIRDSGRAEALYRAALPEWPLPAGALASLLEACGPVLVTEAGDGLVAAHRLGGVGRIALVLVHPDRRRRGIGRSLIGSALARLDVERIHLGAGGVRLWPGLPADLAPAGRFFAALGWRTTGDVFDLTLDLEAWRPEITPRVRVAGPSDMENVLAFQRRHFPAWVAEYQKAGPEEVLLMEEGGIVGTVLVDQVVSWPGLLPGCGALACVGVDPERQGRGLGFELVQAATAEMKRRGRRTGFVGWTDRARFYERAGYRIWRHYASAILRP